MIATRSLLHRHPLAGVARASYGALIVLVVLWEGWLVPSPYAPAGVWLTLKCIPLLALLRGVWLARPRTIVIASLVLLPYLVEAVVLLWVVRDLPLVALNERSMALAELMLVTAYIATGGLALRATARHHRLPEK